MWYIFLKNGFHAFLKKSSSKLLNTKHHLVGKKIPVFGENYPDFGKKSIYLMSNICQRGEELYYALQ